MFSNSWSNLVVLLDFKTQTLIQICNVVSAVKNPPANAGDTDLIPGSGREGKPRKGFMFFLVLIGLDLCVKWLLPLGRVKRQACNSVPFKNFIFTNDVIRLIKSSLVAQLVKNQPAMRETWVPSLGWEDPLEKGTATHSSILACRIPWTV